MHCLQGWVQAERWYDCPEEVKIPDAVWDNDYVEQNPTWWSHCSLKNVLEVKYLNRHCNNLTEINEGGCRPCGDTDIEEYNNEKEDGDWDKFNNQVQDKMPRELLLTARYAHKIER